MKNEYTVIDLFCGAGGLSLGFKNAGFKIIGGIDFDKDAIATHELNFKNSVNIYGDIKEITDDKIKDLFPSGTDIIIGGPPCQGFSSANMWQNDEEKKEKNRLFFEYIRFVKVLKPKAFLIENVRQILTKDDSFAKKEILKIGEELGYNVSYNILVASDYGVPQNRIRAFFIGIKKEFGVHFNFDSLEKRKKVTVKEAISDLYDYEKTNKIGKIGSEYQKLMRKNSNDLVYNHEIRYPNEKVQERMKFVPQGGNWRDVPDKLWDTQRNNRHSSAYRRLKENDISITIDTGHMNYFHPLFNRVPTVRESARIQSFSDDFIFCGSKTSQFRQVGNAVPPLMVYSIAKEIKKILGEKNEL